MGSSLHSSVAKALNMDQDTNQTDLLGSSEKNDYLTLKKFSQSDSNGLARRENQENIVSNNSSRRSSSRSNKSNLFDTYEHQIAKNIQSIRRTSLTNASPPNKSPSPSPVERHKAALTRMSSNESETESALKQTSILKKKIHTATAAVKDDENDDDDIYTSPTVNRKLIDKSSRKSSDSDSASLNKPPQSKPFEHITEDNLFNDDYGAPEEGQVDLDEDEENEDDDDDDDEDDFDQMLKTRNFTGKEVARSTTPRPVPRNPNNQQKPTRQLVSSDDEY